MAGECVYTCFSIQIHLYNAFHDTNLCKAALQNIKVSTLYLGVGYIVFV